jgi:hypothetical protein
MNGSSGCGANEKKCDQKPRCKTGTPRPISRTVVTSSKRKTQEGGKTKIGRTDPILRTARINAVMKEEDPPFQKPNPKRWGTPEKNKVKIVVLR